MLDLVPANLPKNINGFRTTHTCELCGFEPKTKNKYREKQDHLVMKHFKEKIDKIFPHCRPYSCPSGECTFTGKDKQALLRHYTGKHGILEKFLKEALAEKGISYIPGDHGSKRKHNGDHTTNGPKIKKMALVQHQPQTTIIDAKDMLPKSPVPIQNGHSGNSGNNFSNRPNSEDLRKEVEAMMASFQPQPQQEVVTTSTSIKVVQPNLPTTPVPVTVVQQQQNGDLKPKTVILSSKLPNAVTLAHHHHQQHPPTSVVSLLKRSLTEQQPTLIMTNGRQMMTTTTNTTMTTNGHHAIHIPELILPDSPNGQSNGHHQTVIPIEVITTPVTTDNGNTNGNNQVVENEEVMWGAGTLGPAVVVEAADTVPVTYIEASEIVYSAASLDNIDYDYLYPVTTVTSAAATTDTIVRNSAVRERQLEFNML